MEPKTLKKRLFKALTIHLPASKSISNRALIINALSGAGVMPQNVSDCDDTRVMLRALAGQNARDGQGREVIDIMAAGTAMRFLTAYLSVTPPREGEAPSARIITGTERMQNRPIGLLVEALRHLGADIGYVGREGFPPLCIQGRRLEGGEVTLPGHLSSQYISAMLMVGPILEKGLTLHLEGEVVSRPYIDMTLAIMRSFGAEATFVGSTLRVEPTGYKPIPYYIENDWSASSYWFEMVALTPGSEIRLPGLFRESLQGDQGVLDIFRHLGVEASFEELAADGAGPASVLVLRHTGRVAERLDIDMLRVPDLAQTVVVTCCMLGVRFRISGLQSLKIKETDRIFALRTELAKLGYLVREEDDSVLLWEGERCEVAADCSIDTYEDHRMAMAFAPCCQVLGKVVINNPQVVSKSYPGYWTDLDTCLS